MRKYLLRQYRTRDFLVSVYGVLAAVLLVGFILGVIAAHTFN
jgi:hypothetical protein